MPLDDETFDELTETEVYDDEMLEQDFQDQIEE